MARIATLLASLVLIFGAVIFIAYQMIRFLGLTRWSKSRKIRERTEGQKLVGGMLDNPVPWKKEEWDLLSAQALLRRKKRFFSTEYTGKMHTIYGEDAMAFTAKVYGQNQYIVSFGTSETAYSILKKGRQAEVFKGEEMIGWIEGPIMYNKDAQRFASIETTPTGRIIKIGEEDVAHLEIMKGSSMNTRLFKLLRDERIPYSSKDLFTCLLAHFFFTQAVQG
jgi:hypothetical protein